MREKFAGDRLSEVRSPDVVIAVIDLFVSIAVSGESNARLPKRAAPNNVIGCVDGAILVVVAGKWHGLERIQDELDDVKHEAAVRRIVQHFAHQSAGLARRRPGGRPSSSAYRPGPRRSEPASLRPCCRYAPVLPAD